jgi:hypothetical protein
VRLLHNAANLDDAERLAIAVSEFGVSIFRVDASIQCPEKGFWARRATVTLGEWMSKRTDKRRSGIAGGRARAASLSPERRSEISKRRGQDTLGG